MSTLAKLVWREILGLESASCGDAPQDQARHARRPVGLSARAPRLEECDSYARERPSAGRGVERLETDPLSLSGLLSERRERERERERERFLFEEEEKVWFAHLFLRSYLLMVDRGDCTFVTKVRNAQKLGAFVPACVRFGFPPKKKFSCVCCGRYVSPRSNGA